MIKEFVIACLMFFCCTLSYAQQPVDACFSLNKTRFCTGETVVATNCIVPKGTTPASGLFNFGDTDVDTNKYPNQGVQLNRDTSHIYQKAGVYRIKQRGGVKASGGIDDTIIYITVLDARLPQFTVGLCEGFEVSIKVTDNYYNTYSFVPGAGLPAIALNPSQPFTHVYNSTALQTASLQGECGQAVSRDIAPISNLIKPDLFALEAVTNGNAPMVNISFNAIPTMKYKVLEKTYTGAFVAIDTIQGRSGPSSLSYPLSSQKMCYSLASFDDCGNADTSAMLCLNELSVTAGSNLMTLAWEMPPYGPNEFEEFELLKNGVSMGTYASNKLSHIDSDVVCGRNYSYQLVSRLQTVNGLNGDRLQATGLPAAGTAFSNQKPPGLDLLNATVDGDKIQVSWEKPLSAIKTYTISRSENGGGYSYSTTSDSNPFSDEKVDVQNKQYCYKVSYIDSCNNVADESQETCPILLKTVKDDQDRNVSTWTNYLNAPLTVSNYVLDRLDEKDQVVNSFPVNTGNTYPDGPLPLDIIVTKYRIKNDVYGDGSFTTYSNIVTLKNELVLYLPTAFSPNNDGTNDVLLAYGKFFKEFKMSIYNRWGQLTFYSENIKNGWDGNFQGQPAPVDAYVYVVQLKNNLGEDVIKKGDVLLLR